MIGCDFDSKSSHRSASSRRGSTLDQAEARAVEQPAHEPRHPVERVEHGPDLVAGQDDREALRHPGPLDLADRREIGSENASVEEHERAQGLVLRRSRDPVVDRDVGKEPAAVMQRLQACRTRSKIGPGTVPTVRTGRGGRGMGIGVNAAIGVRSTRGPATRDGRTVPGLPADGRAPAIGGLRSSMGADASIGAGRLGSGANGPASAGAVDRCGPETPDARGTLARIRRGSDVLQDTPWPS
jgi:hypothetical protein